MIIGLTGTLASGKAMIAEILKKKGFAYLSLSDVVREEAKQRNLEITREKLQELGNSLRAEQGAAILAIRVLQKVTDPAMNYIIDGIRNPAEIAELRKMPVFYLIAVDAPHDIRFKRLIQRNKPSDPKNYYDFSRLDAADQGKNQPEEGQQVAECMRLADYAIFNNFSLERLQDKVLFVLQQIKNKEALSGGFTVI